MIVLYFRQSPVVCRVTGDAIKAFERKCRVLKPAACLCPYFLLQGLLTSDSNKNTALCLYSGREVRTKALGSLVWLCHLSKGRISFWEISLSCQQDRAADENTKPKSKGD